jgi:hypothetical protein
MTRAKTKLIMTWRQKVPIFTPQGIRTVDKQRSRFLNDLLAKKGRSKDDDEQQKDSRGSYALQGTTSVYARPKGPPASNTVTSYLSNGQTSPGGGGADTRRPKAVSVQQPQAVKYSTAPGRSRGKDIGVATTDVYSAISKRMDSPKLVAPAAPRTTENPRNVPLRNRELSSTKQPNSAPIHPTQSRNQQLQSTRNPPSSPSISSSRTTSTDNQQTVAQIQKKMDSTWFYPVGSAVQHARFGKGTVLPPPPEDTMMVRVLFDIGSQQDFHASGTDLSLELG